MMACSAVPAQYCRGTRHRQSHAVRRRMAQRKDLPDFTAAGLDLSLPNASDSIAS